MATVSVRRLHPDIESDMKKSHRCESMRLFRLKILELASPR